MPFIFPSLSRAPQFANTKSVEDGTVSDPMESGYVATRPRFTRLRRKFGVSYKWLSAEDVRALDFFETQVVKGMAGSFYLPNQLWNGSFELPNLTGKGISGWNPKPSAGWGITLSPNAFDGSKAVLFSLAEAGGPAASIAALAHVAVTVGESYQVCAHANIVQAGVSLSCILALVYADGTTQNLTIALASAPTIGYSAVYGVVTIPASTETATAAVASVSFQAATLEAAAGATILLDSVGLALSSATQPYGRMPGQPLGSQVRFTKTPNVKDAGWMGSAPVYDVSFEVTQV